MPSNLKHSHSIVLLTYNKPDLLGARLGELFNFYRHEPKIDITVVNNGSTDSKMRMELGHWIQKATLLADSSSFKISVHTLTENKGFGGGMAAGVSVSYGEIIHLLSDDVHVYGNFVARIDEDIAEFPDSLFTAEIINRPAGWNQFGDKIINYAQGYYLAMHRKLWDDLGGFDPRFYPYDYEDVDLSYRVSQAGGYLYMKDLPLQHAAAGTIGYNPERFEHTVRMRALFAEKHGLPNIPERP